MLIIAKNLHLNSKFVNDVEQLFLQNCKNTIKQMRKKYLKTNEKISVNDTIYCEFEKKNKILIQKIINSNIRVIIAKRKYKNKIIFANVFAKKIFAKFVRSINFVKTLKFFAK